MRVLALIAALGTLPAMVMPARADQVVVFAAASMKTALDGFAARWSADTGHDVVISYAGSGALARQIMLGAPADIFISAAPKWMDIVQDAGLLAPDTRSDLVGNRLALVAHAGLGLRGPVPVGPDLDLAGLLRGGRLAMALVDAVPAGQYGKAALVSLGLWSVAEPLVAQTDNVRAALSLVATGAVPLGIVYASDAVADPRVAVLGFFPADSHPPIRYPAALLTRAQDAADIAFHTALFSPEAAQALAEQGFRPLD
jgi:molybdate transport system substrate-binding protein